MSALTYKITLSSAAKMEMSAGVVAALGPMLNQAVNGIAQATAANWIEAIHRAKMWSGEKDAYAKTITYRMTGEFSAIVESDYKAAEEIESGRPARDLKKMLNTSNKVRTSKDGTRYLIIPMRHSMESLKSTSVNTMDGPKSAYLIAKALTPSSIVGQGKRVSGTGAYDIKSRKPVMVNQNKYKWGASLDRADEEMPKNLKGMYRFNTSTKGAPRSTYLTFRVMSEKSRGWIIPAQPGQHIAQGVAERMQSVANDAFTEAVKRATS